MMSAQKEKALRVLFWILGLFFILACGIPTLFTIRPLIILVGIPWPEQTMPALFFARHAGAAWLGWGLVFLLAARDMSRYVPLLKLCFILMVFDVIASILNVSFEGFASLGNFILISYLLGVIVLFIMAFLIPWKRVQKTS